MSEKKDAIATMGAILPDDVSGRDAVHVAVISAVAGDELFPADDVGIASTTQDGEGEPVARTDAAKLIGIVDPFLKSSAKAGQRFWLFVYPRTITGLKHVWTHPDVASQLSAAPVKPEYGPLDVQNSEDWLQDYCRNTLDTSYVAFMRTMTDLRPNDLKHDTICLDNDISGNRDIPDEMWHHIEVVSGRKFTGKRPSFFHCAC